MSSSFTNGTASHFIELIDEEDSIFFQSETFSDGSRQEFTTATEVTGTRFADMIFGASTDDTLRGGDGDDVIACSEGDDQLFGGAGNDTFMFDFDGGNDEVTLGDGNDTIFIEHAYADELILEATGGGGLKISVLGEDQEITVNDFYDLDNGKNRLVVRDPSTGELTEYNRLAVAMSQSEQNEVLNITGGIPEDATTVRDIFFEAAELRPEADILQDGPRLSGFFVDGKPIGGEFDPINDFEPEIA